MRNRIAIGTALLFTLGTAVAGTLIYGQGQPERAPQPRAETIAAVGAVTPETIAMWRASAASIDDVALKVPL